MRSVRLSPHEYTIKTLLSAISPIQSTFQTIDAHLGGDQFKRVTIIHSDKAPMRLKLL